MAGPADYLRLTGPLGGANFLNTSDYIRGAQASMMPANQTMDIAQQGAQIGQTIAQTRAWNQQTQQRQQQAAQEEQQRKSASEAMKWAAQTMTSAAQVQQPAQPAQQATPMQTAEPMPTAPVTGIQGGERTAPVTPQAPVVQSDNVQPVQRAATAQAAPMPAQQAAPAPAPQVIQQAAPAQPSTMPQAAPVRAAPQQPVMPPTTAAQASQQPVPQSAAAQTAQQAAPQPLTLSQRERKIDDEILTIQKTHDLVMSKLYEDVQAGKISPEAASIVEQGLANKRKSDVDRIIAFETKKAEIAEKWANSNKTEEDALKIRRERAIATVEFENSGYYQVKKTFETMGPEMAVAEAASLGLDPTTVVTKDGKLSSEVERRAKNSPEAREERKAAEIKWSLDKETGIATGINSKGDIFFKDSEGKTITSAEFRALNVTQKERIARAGRPVSSGNGTGPRLSTSQSSAEPGKLSGLERDRQGNLTLSKDITDGLRDAARQFTNAERGLRELSTIEQNDYVNKASASGAGALAVAGQRFVGYEGDMRKASEALERFANSALGIIESPLMKGAPSEADARRALSVINDPSSSVETKKEALGQLKTALEEARDRYRDSVEQFDTPTKQRLKAAGLPIPTPSPAAAQKNTPGSVTQPATSGIPKGWSVTVIGGK